MPQGLPVSRLVNVTVNLAGAAASALNFDSLLVMGSSGVIDVVTRIKSFGSLSEVGDYFSNSDPEYLAAQDFFAQVPQPAQLYIGEWAEEPTSGQLIGGAVSAANQLIAAWTPINNGGFKIAIDGVGPQNVGNINFAGAANLNAVAALIEAAIPGGTATCVWDANDERFVITSDSSGVDSSISFATAPDAGTDISAMLAMLVTSSGAYVADGIAAETPAEAVAVMDDLKTQWYGVTFASTSVTDEESLAVGALVEGDGVNNPHVFGVTTSEGAALIDPDTTSIGAQLKAAGYNRSLAQFSSSSPYAISSFFGRAFTVDFNGNGTTIDLMYKNEPGVTPEDLNSTQADALDASNYNYFATFNNQTSIIVNGKVASGQFFDTVWGVDWLANQIKTNVYNILYGSTTKIPQTDAGNNVLASAIAAACDQGVANGLVAPGVWNQAGFGQLKQGDYLDKGYYIYQPPVSLQSEADRQARRSVLFQVAVKLAGSVQTVDVVVNVNQ